MGTICQDLGRPRPHPPVASRIDYTRYQGLTLHRGQGAPGALWTKEPKGPKRAQKGPRGPKGPKGPKGPGALLAPGGAAHPQTPPHTEDVIA